MPTRPGDGTPDCGRSKAVSRLIRAGRHRWRRRTIVALCAS